MQHRYGCRNKKKSYFCGMYVRKKPNRSGTTSVVILEKSDGKVRYLKTIGVSDDKSEIGKLYRQGKKWIAATRGERDMFTEHDRMYEEKQVKELERILRLKDFNLSVDKVLDIAKTITTLKIRLSLSNETLTKTMLLTKKHLAIASLYNENFWKNV
jgi:hypothetical protein